MDRSSIKTMWILVGILLVFAGMIGCGSKQEEPAQEEITMDDLLAEEENAGDSAADKAWEEETLQKPEESFPGPEPVAPSFNGEFVEDGRYVVQISASPFQMSAQKLAEKLKNDGYPAYLVEVENPSAEATGTYYRVRIGGFSGLSMAESFGNSVLSAQGYSWWADNKSNDNAGGMDYGTGSDMGAPASESMGSGGMSNDNWGTAAPAPAEPEAPAAEPTAPAQAAPATPPAATTPAEPAAEPTVPAATEPAAPAAPAQSAPAQDDWGIQNNQQKEEAKSGGDDWGDDWGSDSEW